MATEWDGGTKVTDIKADAANARVQLADAARSCHWQTVFDIVSRFGFVNCARPGGASLYAPLHQAAYAGASVDVVDRLIALGAWRTLRNARGERAIDVAQRMGHHQLSRPLAPVLKHQVPLDVLSQIQSHFHEVIRGRIDQPLPHHALRLPELEPLLELEEPQMWFPVPGMYGGFSYRLESTGADAKLVAESWCRVVGGSGQRHEITQEGSRLVAEGFV